MNEKKTTPSESPKKSTDKTKSVEEEKNTIDLIADIVDDFSSMEEIQKPYPKKTVDYLVSSKPTAEIEKKTQDYFVKQKEYSSYEQVRTEYPLFLQLPNACGFSSILMLIDPNQNEQIGNLLNRVWNHVKKMLIKDQNRKEFQWTFALEYLLLKSATSNVLTEYIWSLEEEETEYYYITLKSLLGFHKQEYLKEKENDIVSRAYDYYFDNGYVTQWILTPHIQMFKNNLEIRILMALCGYRFVKQAATDGTGALFFTEEELKDLQLLDTKKKITLLRSEFIKGARIIVGFSFHWSVLTNIFNTKDSIILAINDPAGKKYNMSIQDLSEKDRFYIFRRIKTKPNFIWKHINKLLEEDGPREIEVSQEILKTLQEQSARSLESIIEDNISVEHASNSGEKSIQLPKKSQPISVKVHEKTIERLKRNKTFEDSEKLKEELPKDTDEEKSHPSKKAVFRKKLDAIIGTQDKEENS